MRSSFFFYVRLVFAWAFLLVFALAFWSTFTRRGQGGIFLLWVIVMIFVITSAISHVRRVRLINGSANAGTLANRQRRQIEMPIDAGRAFDILDAAIRELPNVEEVASARDSLQIRAKVRRVYSYGGAVPLLQWMLGWFGAERNQIFATITPHPDTGTVNLVCEPEGGAWRDWFTVDNGTNLENAEAISRAMSHRITEVRRGEQEATKETQTEKELAIAKLQLLHAQVEPHFLYNTLGSAKYLVRSDPEGAERIIDNLILYLRHSLPRLENSLTTLGDELERVRAYLDIMQIRMGARLKTELNVPDALKLRSVPHDDAADARRELDQARTGAQVGRRDDLDPGGRQGGPRCRDHRGRRQRPRHRDHRQRHRPAQRARTAASRLRRRRVVRPRGQLPGGRGRDHHGAHDRPETGSP